MQMKERCSVQGVIQEEKGDDTEETVKLLSQKPWSKSQQREPRIFLRPRTLIIQQTDKAKYSDILDRIKQYVSYDQARDKVDKIHKTKDGYMIITLSWKSTDKG